MSFGETNYIGAISTNNGIRQTISAPFTWKGNCITVNYNGSVGCAFYQPYDFYASDDVNVLYPLGFNLDENIALYLCTSIFKASTKYSYSTKWTKERMAQSFIIVPKKDNALDYDFMRRYMATLKAERVATLKAYLQATGLSNTILTEGELAALEALRQNRVKWIEVPVCGKDGAFDIVNTHCILNSQVVPNSGNIPYVGAGESNNSILSYISLDKNYLEKGNSIMIAGKTLVITYQETDYFSNDSHNLALYYKYQQNQNKELLLFLVSSLHCSLKPKYHWGDSISKSKIKNDRLMLPITTEGEIDYSFINNLTNAITKLCIDEILNIKDLEISATEEITKQEETPPFPIGNLNNILQAAEPYEVYGYSDIEASSKFTEREPLLVGCYKSSEHLQWILNQNKYNIRLGDRVGSMDEQKEIFNKTHKLVLYNIEDPTEIRVMEISAPKEINGKQINEMGYPDTRPDHYRYEIFNTQPSNESTNQYSDLVKEIISKTGHIEGAPVFITEK